MNGKIAKLATSHSVEVQVAREVLDYKFRQHWAEIKDTLAPELVKEAKRGGYREVQMDKVIKLVGKARLFEPVLADIVREYMHEQKQEMLLLSRLDLVEGVMTYDVKGVIYLAPDVTWKVADLPGVGSRLKVQANKRPANIVESMLAAELERLQNQSAVLTASDGAAVDGNMVTVSCESVFEDGTRFEEGCFKSSKWLLKPGQLNLNGLYEALLGTHVGSHVEPKFTLPERFNELAGKAVTLKIDVEQVMERIVPSINDEFAAMYKYQGIENMKNSIKAEIIRYLEQQDEYMRMLGAISQIVTPDVVEVGPVPFDYLKHKALEIYVSSRKTVRTEEELWSALATTLGTTISSKEEALSKLAQEAGNNLVRDLVLRSWGRLAGVEGDSSLELLSEYSDVVQTYILNHTDIEYSEQPNTGGTK